MEDKMSFLQLQPHKGKTGENVTYAHLAWSVWDKRKQRPRQHRFYIGRLDETGEGVVVNKKFASSNRVVIPLAEVKEMAKRMGEFELWLRNVCAKKSGMGGAPLDVTAKVEVVGDVHCLLSLSESVGLKQSLEKVFGHDMGGRCLVWLCIKWPLATLFIEPPHGWNRGNFPTNFEVPASPFHKCTARSSK